MGIILDMPSVCRKEQRDRLIKAGGEIITRNYTHLKMSLAMSKTLPIQFVTPTNHAIENAVSEDDLMLTLG